MRYLFFSLFGLFTGFVFSKIISAADRRNLAKYETRLPFKIKGLLYLIELLVIAGGTFIFDYIFNWH